MKRAITLILALMLCIGTLALPALADEVKYDPPLASASFEERFSLSLIFSDVLSQEEVTVSAEQTELFRVSQGSTVTFEYSDEKLPDSFPNLYLLPAENKGDGTYIREYGKRDQISYYDHPHTITLDQPGLWLLSISPSALEGAPLLRGGSVVLDVVEGGTAATPAPATDTPAVAVTVNGTPVQWTDAAPFIDENNRTMVPLRAVADALGLSVYWDEGSRMANFYDESQKAILFFIGETTARTKTGETVGEGEPLEMDTAPVIVNDRTYAPVRYLAEYFGHSVGWDAGTRTVIIQ